MQKISTSPGFETHYIEDIKEYFKVGNFRYKDVAKAVNLLSGLSFKKLLVAKPKMLSHYITIASAEAGATEMQRDEAKQLLNDVYKNFRSRKISKDLIARTNLKACPYCNRNFIFNFKRSNSTEATAQLDHFYPKNKYPYLAISLYNLIPCCSTCNLRKSNKLVDSYHPYLESFNANARFAYKGIAVQPKGKNYDFFDEKRIKLALYAINNQEKIKVNSHKETFNLEALYDNHKDIVQELIKKSQIYTESYIDDLEKQYIGKVFNSRDELLRLITSGHVTDEEINQRPLNKLVKDISQQLEIY